MLDCNTREAAQVAPAARAPALYKLLSLYRAIMSLRETPSAAPCSPSVGLLPGAREQGRRLHAQARKDAWLFLSDRDDETCCIVVIC